MITTTRHSARNESIKISLLLTLLCLTILYGNWLWRWDRLIYDVQSSHITHKANDDIVIIAIDEASLKSIGRWPWPRSVHARLLDILTQYHTRAILIDVVFSEPSTILQNDKELVSAMQKNGKVSLPIIVEQTRLRGQLIETLPLPALTQSASNMGHVHVELDPDGIARGTYLYEGVGEARWPHIALALLNKIDEVNEAYTTPDLNNLTSSTSWTLIRREHFLIPFIGPPGSYKTISYLNVLNKQVLADTLTDKIVLIGVTASGLGDSLPTPVSGLSQPMPGIEINANIVQGIKSGTLIHSIEPALHYLVSAVLVMLPILLFPYLTPRMTLFLVFSEILIIYLLSFMLLHWFHIWVPISAVLICILLAYPLWAWRRLEFTVKYLNTELETLSREANEIEQYVAQNNEQSFEFLQHLLPVKGITVYGMNNEIIKSSGEVCKTETEKLSESCWTKISDSIYGRKIIIIKTVHKVCVCWKSEAPPDDRQNKILKTYIRQWIKPQIEQAKTTVEIIESRIREIQTTTDKLTYLRQLITDSLEQMADGVIVIDNLGIVTLANKQAIRLIGSDPNISLLHQPIQPVLETLTLSTGESWDFVINALLSNKHYENLQVRTDKNKDLVINISALFKPDKSITGFIINLSDFTEIKDAQRKRSEILSFLSHDFRSPLVSILAMIEQNKINNNSNELNKYIEKNIIHTIQLAEDFIHLSRVESDDDIKLNHINISDVIANAIDTVWGQASIKKIQIQQDLIIDGWVLGNGAILERVIINLLTNAIQYSHKNCTISISLDKHDSKIICCIKDNGPGINQSDIPYLFDRFNRARQQNQKQAKATPEVDQGIGLGLAFVHAAIERHHGTISVKSKLGDGTEFCVSLPEQL